MEEGSLPMGLGLLLMQNEAAMQRYNMLTEAEKEKLVFRLRGVKSKAEMRRLVSELGERPIPSDIYPVIDTDLARDNVENDQPAADRQELS
ncbi:MAG: hypothetical protein IKQ69_07465 [Oscillospiraceae bacterium]|nr:hypothetical protein [Oscillospiraceae bacterium]MBR6208822.1 hypothetical protein [Oscillospiraceae bacterium]